MDKNKEHATPTVARPRPCEELVACVWGGGAQIATRVARWAVLNGRCRAALRGHRRWPGSTPRSNTGRACGQPDPRRVPPRPDSQPARAAWPAATTIGQLTTAPVPPAAGPTHPRRPAAGPIRRLWPSPPPLRDTLPPAAGETTRHAVPPMQRGKTWVAMVYPQPSPSLPSSLHRESSTAIREPRPTPQLAAPASLPCVAHLRAGAAGPPFQIKPGDTMETVGAPRGRHRRRVAVERPPPTAPPPAVQFGRSAVSNGRFGLPPSGGPSAATASLFRPFRWWGGPDAFADVRGSRRSIWTANVGGGSAGTERQAALRRCHRDPRYTGVHADPCERDSSTVMRGWLSLPRGGEPRQGGAPRACHASCRLTVGR